MNALALRDNDDPSTSNQPPMASSTTPGQWLQHFCLSNQPTCHPFILGTVPSLPDAFPKLVSTLSFLLHLHTELRINHTPYSTIASMHALGVDSHYHHRTSTTPPYASTPRPLTTTRQQPPSPRAYYHQHPAPSTSTSSTTTMTPLSIPTTTPNGDNDRQRPHSNGQCN